MPTDTSIYRKHLTILTPQVQRQFNQHYGYWHNCVRCEIGQTAHHHVFARGTLPCDVLFVGMAPGKTEDATGVPFVGQAGQLLDQWIGEALSKFYINGRDDIALTCAVTNLVCCRPTDRMGGPNRDPFPTEIHNCNERLQGFLNMASPRAVVFLGKVAARWGKRPIALQAFLPSLQLFHPAFFLYKRSVGTESEIGERRKLATFLINTFTSQKEARP